METQFDLLARTDSTSVQQPRSYRRKTVKRWNVRRMRDGSWPYSCSRPPLRGAHAVSGSVVR